MENRKFYNSVSTGYDEMISFEKSLEKKFKIFKNFITSGMIMAADCGCGTGVDSVALSKLGLIVSAFDPSEEMISIARNNAKTRGEEIEFENYPIKGIPEDYNNKFDVLVSFGNTFANICKPDFEESIKRCYELLKKNGMIIIHILNYQLILKEKKRIVNITQGRESTYIRFYDFIDEKIHFNILSFTNSNSAEHKLVTTEVFPHSMQDFESTMLAAGFDSHWFYSNLKFDEFDVDNSKDLFIKAIRK